MTQEKLKRVVTAAAVAGTLVVVCLLAVLLYQVIHIAVLNKRIKTVQNEIDYWTEMHETAENDLDHYLSDFYLDWAAHEKGFIYPGEK